jgi:hypothetical protein
MRSIKKSQWGWPPPEGPPPRDSGRDARCPGLQVPGSWTWMTLSDSSRFARTSGQGSASESVKSETTTLKGTKGDDEYHAKRLLGGYLNGVGPSRSHARSRAGLFCAPRLSLQELAPIPVGGKTENLRRCSTSAGCHGFRTRNPCGKTLASGARVPSTEPVAPRHHSPRGLKPPPNRDF